MGLWRYTHLLVFFQNYIAKTLIVALHLSPSIIFFPLVAFFSNPLSEINLPLPEIMGDRPPHRTTG